MQIFSFYAFVSLCTVIVSQSPSLIYCDSPFTYNPSIQKCVFTEYYTPTLQSSDTDICAPGSIFDFDTCVNCRVDDLYVCDMLCVSMTLKEPNIFLNNTAPPRIHMSPINYPVFGALP